MVGEDSSLSCQSLGCLPGSIPEKLHDLLRRPDRTLLIIWYAQFDEHICKAHHTQANLAVGKGHLPNLRKRVGVDFYHII